MDLDQVNQQDIFIMWVIKLRKSITLICGIIITICHTYGQKPIGIIQIDPHKVHIPALEEEYRTFSIIDSNQVVIDNDKRLLFVSNDKIIKEMAFPDLITAFDISRNGNGIVVVNGEFIYIIKHFILQPNHIKTILFNPQISLFINRVDMINDTIIRLFVNMMKDLLYIHIDSLKNNNYKVCNDSVSRFIVKHGSGCYIGEFNNEYYFLNDSWNGPEFLEISSLKFDKNNKLLDKRSVNLGELGQSWQLSVPVRYDEELGIFYIMLTLSNKINIYKYRMKDFSK
jgi:hypothetical protein